MLPGMVEPLHTVLIRVRYRTTLQVILVISSWRKVGTFLTDGTGGQKPQDVFVEDVEIALMPYNYPS